MDAFADCHGHGNIEVARALGVPVRRINSQDAYWRLTQPGGIGRVVLTVSADN